MTLYSCSFNARLKSFIMNIFSMDTVNKKQNKTETKNVFPDEVYTKKVYLFNTISTVHRLFIALIRFSCLSM